MKLRLTLAVEVSSLEQSCAFRSVGALVEGPYWPQREAVLFLWSAACSARRGKRDYAVEVSSKFKHVQSVSQR